MSRRGVISALVSDAATSIRLKDFLPNGMIETIGDNRLILSVDRSA